MMMNKPKKITECSNCTSIQKWVLHNIRHRGDIRKFCTSCVLKLHPGLFCPNCFEVYETSNLSSSIAITSTNRVTCLKCPSVVHHDCISKDIVNRYVCPTCLNPNFDFVDLGKPLNDVIPSSRVIDLNKAKVFLAAATISSVSMERAALTLRVEAEKRVKEAAIARKIAKDVLENVNVVAMEEKEKKDMNMEVGGSSSVIVPVEEEKKEKKPKGSRYAVEKSKGNSAVAAAVAAQKRFQSQVSLALTDGKGKDKSRDGFGSREKETPIQFYSPPPPVQKPLSNGVLGNQQAQSSGATLLGKEKNRLISFAHGVKQTQGNSSEGEKVDMFQNLMKEFNISTGLQKNQANGL
ncbi:hypothetical protein MKW98_003404 [Papaver atlanticum]|uniref:Uncharacterized protein n=1 Tax=Papaver atlanticum TaxID=357466 RepID=A0AAD4XRK9_9MAGN|nr:hypothetical protein MKW98_003404 [Papaver atlanticum]